MEKWSNKKIELFRQQLLNWYDTQGRANLPWRKNHEPYRVLVSEIMLQQTQVDTVLPYFERFMSTLPTVKDLADADEDVVLKLWEGLGYYSRARHLQKAAQFLTYECNGVWPTTAKDLQQLPGVGPYTAAAIASISFNEVVPAVDGNMFRVFSRLLKIEDDIARPKTRQVFYDAILPIVDPVRPGDFNQAIMDLGSSYMTAKNPDSEHSPVKYFNQAYLDGVEMNYPVKSKKVKAIRQKFLAYIYEENGAILFEKRPDSGLLANFWTFPLLQQHDDFDVSDITQGELLNIKPITHIFTHRRWEIWLVKREHLPEKQSNQRFLTSEEWQQLSLPTVQHKLLKSLEENNVYK